MTSAEAAALHTHASRGGAYVLWFITLTDRAYPGQAVAWARVGSVHTSTRLRGELVANTIEDVRAMLPPGLKQLARSIYDPVGTVEAWD